MTETKPGGWTPGFVLYIPFRYSTLNCGQIIHIHIDYFWIVLKNISAGLIFHRQFGNTLIYTYKGGRD